jgi:hypothetical protein
MTWKARRDVTLADAERAQHIANGEGLRVRTGENDATVEQVRALADAAEATTGFLPQLRPGSKLAKRRAADLRWLARFLAEEEADIAEGLRLLRLAVASGDVTRAERIRRELRHLYPWLDVDAS